MSMELAQCPFCGSRHATLEEQHEHASPSEHFVRCPNCHAQGPSFWSGNTPDNIRSARDSWDNAWCRRVIKDLKNIALTR